MRYEVRVFLYERERDRVKVFRFINLPFFPIRGAKGAAQEYIIKPINSI